MQDLSGARDKASIFFLKCTRDDHTAAVMDEMRAILPGYEIRPLKDFLSLDDLDQSARAWTPLSTA